VRDVLLVRIAVDCLRRSALSSVIECFLKSAAACSAYDGALSVLSLSCAWFV